MLELTVAALRFQREHSISGSNQTLSVRFGTTNPYHVNIRTYVPTIPGENSMKNVAIGCLIFAVLAALVGGIVSYQYIIKPMMHVGTGLMELGQTAQKIQEMEADVRNRSNYDAPEHGRIDPAQFQRLLAVQRDMRQTMQGKLDELQTRYKSLSEEYEAAGKEPALTDIMQAYQDLGSLILEAKRAQVDALNRSGFSLEEYQWVRNQTYTALGVGLAGAAAYQQEYVGSELARQVPPENAELVAEHAEELGENVALIWFGL